MKRIFTLLLVVALTIGNFAVGAQARTLKDVEKTMRANPAFAFPNASWDKFEKADVDALKKAAGALGLVDIISYGGDDTKGFMQAIRIAQFKATVNNAKAKKFWDAYCSVHQSAGMYGDPIIVTKGNIAAYYLKESIPASAIKALPKVL